MLIRMKIISCFFIIMLSLLTFASFTMAETDPTPNGKTVYELQVVYPAPLVYISDFGIGMQGKYYFKPGYYLGWYTPVRFIFPGEQKHMWDSNDLVVSDVQIKLLGTFGHTSDKRYFTFDNSLIAGWRYWYTKTTAYNPTYNINSSYENTSLCFEWGSMSIIRWKMGESLKLASPFNRLNLDFYAYWPLTDDFFKSESLSELALGFSYIF